MSTIYIIVWVLCSYWGYKVMEDKNRNPIVGAVLGFFLGIFGVIICYCHKDKAN